MKSAEIFEKSEIEGIKRENTCKILGVLESKKKKKKKKKKKAPGQPTPKNANLLICQLKPKEYMKTDFTN